jgi:hypothetical protein
MPVLFNVGRFGIKKMLVLEREYNQTRAETIRLVKKFLNQYIFYTSLGKKIGKEGIKIRKNWLKKEVEKRG